MSTTKTAVDLALAKILEVRSALTPDQRAELESRVLQLALFRGGVAEIWSKVEALQKELAAMGSESLAIQNGILEVTRGSLQFKLAYVDFRRKLRRRKPNEDLDRSVLRWRDVEKKTFSQIAKEIANVTGRKCNSDAAWKRYTRATKRLR